jgi:hypothetical protein
MIIMHRSLPNVQCFSTANTNSTAAADSKASCLLNQLTLNLPKDTCQKP